MTEIQTTVHKSVFAFTNKYLHECCDKLNIPKHANKPKLDLILLLLNALQIKNSQITYDELKALLDKSDTIYVPEPPKKIIIQVKRTRKTKAPDKIKELVNAFAIKHSLSDRKIFKTQWQQWIISGEINDLLHEVYADDTDRETIIAKLFFSARYYHRKKELKKNAEEEQTQTQEDQTQEPKKRAYNKTDKTVLHTIDQHLNSLEKDANGFLLKPSAAFDQFINIHGQDHEEYKKTYKNRFYNIEKQIINKQPKVM